jgi:hypothetical protein
MKKIFIMLLLAGLTYSQQQQHIPWPSFADSPWPTTRGDAQATGRSKFVGPKTPNVIWRKDMPFGIMHGPVIGYNDNLFVGTFAFRGLTGDSTNYFYSLDKNGNNIWVYETNRPHSNQAGPTILNDGSIYFASSGSSGGGLYALDPEGKLKWNNKRFMYIAHTRYIAVAKNHDIYLRWLDSLYILEPENGTIIDSINTPHIYADIVFSTGGDTIYYFSGIQPSHPKKINAVTIQGEHLWSLEIAHNYGTPVVDNNNRIYIFAAETPANKFLYCLNPDGAVNWKYPLAANENFESYSSPTIDRNGNIIFPSSIFHDSRYESDSGYVTSLDYNGNLNWSTSIGNYWSDGAFINSGLVSDAEGKIYCGSTYGINTNFWCIDSDGTILWKLDLEGYQYDTSPAINSEGTLYIGTHLQSWIQNHERNLIAVSDDGLSVDDEKQEMALQLYQNYPNPFNPTTHIEFMLTERTNVTLKIFNTLGEEIKTLVNEEMIPGYYSRIFDGKNLPSGVYFYELVTSKTRITKKMILMR